MFYPPMALNSIKTLKRYSKVSLNVFFNRKNSFDDDKKSYLYDIFFVWNQNIATKHL